MQIISKKITFIIIPFALIILGILYIHSTGIYFLRSVDPEYGYLTNGLLFANFKFNIFYTDHPGIILDYIIALTIRIVHIFRPGQSLTDDVLLNPELYIRSSLIAINIINAVATFCLGDITLRLTGKLSVSLFMQLLSFTHLITLEVLGRLMPESIMHSIVCLWLILFIYILYGNNADKKLNLLFALILAISLSNKVTFITYSVIPLIVISGWKNKLKFIGYFIIFFSIIAFPVILNHKYFIRWLLNIFVHTGAYGGGESGIVKWNDFYYHFKLLFSSTQILFWSLGILIALFIINIRVIKIFISDRLKLRFFLAIILQVVFQYIITCKHFAYHYMIPSILLIPFVIFLIGENLRILLPKISNSIYNIFYGACGILLIISLIPKVNLELKQIKHGTDIKIETYILLQPMLDNTPTIISASYYGCSSVKYALSYGLFVSGKYGNYLNEKVQKLYPSTYIYLPWGKSFYEGNKEIKPEEFIKPFVYYTVYIADFSDKLFHEILISLQNAFPGYKTQTSTLRKFDKSNEAIFQLKFVKSGN